MVEIKNDGMMWALVKRKAGRRLMDEESPNSRSWAE